MSAPYVDLGAVSAYAAAQEGGYTGTYDEFCALLAGIAHLDDRYCTEQEVDTKLAGKSDTGHTHDDRYYTEGEVDTKLAGKSDTGHKHSTADVTSGTLAVARGGTGQTTLTPAIATKAARAIYAGTGALTAGTTPLATGLVYLQYE